MAKEKDSVRVTQSWRIARCGNGVVQHADLRGIAHVFGEKGPPFLGEHDCNIGKLVKFASLLGERFAALAVKFGQNPPVLMEYDGLPRRFGSPCEQRLARRADPSSYMQMHDIAARKALAESRISAYARQSLGHHVARLCRLYVLEIADIANSGVDVAVDDSSHSAF